MLRFPQAGPRRPARWPSSVPSAWAWTVRVPVRIGIHAGNAKAEAGDSFGRTVVLAARIANAANGGEVLVSEVVQVGLDGAFALDGARSLTLKGLAVDQLAFPVLWD